MFNALAARRPKDVAIEGIKVGVLAAVVVNSSLMLYSIVVQLASGRAITVGGIAFIVVVSTFVACLVGLVMGAALGFLFAVTNTVRLAPYVTPFALVALRGLDRFDPDTWLLDGILRLSTALPTPIHLLLSFLIGGTFGVLFSRRVERDVFGHSHIAETQGLATSS